MNYLEKIALLENLINQTVNWNVIDSQQPIFKIWEDDVKQALKKIYGEESFEFKIFFDINFSCSRLDSYVGDCDDEERFRQGMNKAIEYLSLYKNRISETDNQMDNVADSNTPIPNDSNIQIRKIFISHASKDKELVGELIDLIQDIGVSSEQIFCTSFEEFGITLGGNFIETIKSELSQSALVLFVLTENFYQSPVCMCEMGAVWALSQNHVPIVVPPLDYQDIKGVISQTQGLKITDKDKWNSLKLRIENLFDLNTDLHASRWERKRDKAIKEFERLTAQQIQENV